MRTDQLSFEGQDVFERVVTGLIGIGAATGVLLVPFTEGFSFSGPALTVAMVGGFALLFASQLRGSDSPVPLGLRVLGVFAAAMVGVCLQSVTAMVLAMAGFAGVVLGAEAGGSGRRHLLGMLAGAVGATWALWAIPALERLVPGLPMPVRSVLTGALSGLFLGGGLLLLHVRVHADAVAARLRKVTGETGVRLQRTWDRCHRSLLPAAPSTRREVLALLEVNAREAERLASQLTAIDARLVAADRKDAESQVASLRADVAQATDAMTRERLQSAVASISDSLEALDAMERKRERMGAELKLKLATLERAALALESAQGEPAEIKTLMLRLSAPPASC